jgi:hypothetical protein
VQLPGEQVKRWRHPNVMLSGVGLRELLLVALRLKHLMHKLTYRSNQHNSKNVSPITRRQCNIIPRMPCPNFVILRLNLLVEE